MQPRVGMLLAFCAVKPWGLFLGGAATGQICSELGWDRVSGSVGPQVLGGAEL